jgi:hypothetical protein
MGTTIFSRSRSRTKVPISPPPSHSNPLNPHNFPHPQRQEVTKIQRSLPQKEAAPTVVFLGQAGCRRRVIGLPRRAGAGGGGDVGHPGRG